MTERETPPKSNEELMDLTEALVDQFESAASTDTTYGAFDALEDLFTGLVMYLETKGLGEAQDYLAIGQKRADGEPS